MSIEHPVVNLSRRQFLVSGATLSGAFLLGLPAVSFGRAPDPGSGGKLGFFIEIRPDNSVIIGSNQPEIGQAIRSA